MAETSFPAALSGLRIVEIGGDEGAYAGKLFADMGAQVLRFRSGTDSPDAQYFDLGKTVLPLDPTGPEGQARLRLALADADAVIDSLPLGALDGTGLAPDQVVARNPALIWARITPFGDDGPFSRYRSADIVNMAMGGMLGLAGYPDRAPVLAGASQSFKIGSLYAATAILTARYEQQRSGLGQRIEVPIQHAVATALENAIQFYDLQGVVRKRSGPGYAEAASGLFRCSDGHIFLMAGRLSTLRGWRSLVEWLNEELPAEAAPLLEPQWNEQAWKARPEAAAAFRAIFETFARSWRKQDLYLEAQRRGIALCPVNAIADVLEDPQLAARGFFRRIPGAGGRDLLLPGPPYRLSATPARLALTLAEPAVHDH